MWRRFFTLSRQAPSLTVIARTMATIPETISRMVTVRSLEGEDKFNLILDDSSGNHHRMLRDKREHVSKTLNRLVLTSMKSQQKNRKRKRKHTGEPIHDSPIIPPPAHSHTGGGDVPTGSAPPTAEVGARLYSPSGDLVDGDVPNIEAWVEDSVLVVGSAWYRVCVNPPTVLALKLPKFAMTDCPLVPEVELEFTDSGRCKWEWLHCPLEMEAETDSADHTPTILSMSLAYWPSEQDSGHKLLVKCTPTSPDGSKIGETVTAVSPVVAESPKVTPITRRHLLTPARLDQADMFRMVTYNTLAGVFTAEEYAQKRLYPYCDPTALDIEYRQGRLVHELLGYNADVLSLQEVGTATYKKFLLPALREKGYNGCHQQKSGSINEGEAIFFDTSKFTLVAQEHTSISEFLANDRSCSEILEGLSSAPSFKKEVMSKSSLVLVALLRSVDRPNSYLLVANTHLYYHPKGDHIRLVQAAVMVKYLEAKLEEFSRVFGSGREGGVVEGEGGGAEVATVIGGDLNSCPCIAAYQFMVTGCVGGDHGDWMGYRLKDIPRCACYYKYNFDGMRGEEVLPPHIQFKLDQSASSLQPSEDNFRGIELRHGFHFQNVTGTDQCTNYTSGFKAVLDYIFIDSDCLSVDRVVPLPSEAEVSEFVALPSVYFPSDHLALVADLKWKK